MTNIWVVMSVLEMKIKGLGYDRFIGRVVSPDNTERYVSLNLKTLNGNYHTDFCWSYQDIGQALSWGNKIMLARGPGQLLQFKDEEGPIQLNRFEPFTPEQMAELRERFEADPEMQKYENPFENQPTLGEVVKSYLTKFI